MLKFHMEDWKLFMNSVVAKETRAWELIASPFSVGTNIE